LLLRTFTHTTRTLPHTDTHASHAPPWFTPPHGSTTCVTGRSPHGRCLRCYTRLPVSPARGLPHRTTEPHFRICRSGYARCGCSCAPLPLHAGFCPPCGFFATLLHCSLRCHARFARVHTRIRFPFAIFTTVLRSFHLFCLRFTPHYFTPRFYTHGSTVSIHMHLFVTLRVHTFCAGLVSFVTRTLHTTVTFCPLVWLLHCPTFYAHHTWFLHHTWTFPRVYHHTLVLRFITHTTRRTLHGCHRLRYGRLHGSTYGLAFHPFVATVPVYPTTATHGCQVTRTHFRTFSHSGLPPRTPVSPSHTPHAFYTTRCHRLLHVAYCLPVPATGSAVWTFSRTVSVYVPVTPGFTRVWAYLPPFHTHRSFTCRIFTPRHTFARTTHARLDPTVYVYLHAHL